jgi:hypothetical protein
MLNNNDNAVSTNMTKGMQETDSVERKYIHDCDPPASQIAGVLP